MELTSRQAGVVALTLAVFIAGVAFYAAERRPMRPEEFNYQLADESGREVFLRHVADRLEKKVLSDADEGARILAKRVDARLDRIYFTLRYADAYFELAEKDALSAFTEGLEAQACDIVKSHALYGTGVEIRLNLQRPSGAALGQVRWRDADCFQASEA